MGEGGVEGGGRSGNVTRSQEDELVDLAAVGNDRDTDDKNDGGAGGYSNFGDDVGCGVGSGSGSG